jgi:hypothetical protein
VTGVYFLLRSNLRKSRISCQPFFSNLRNSIRSSPFLTTFLQQMEDASSVKIQWQTTTRKFTWKCPCRSSCLTPSSDHCCPSRDKLEAFRSTTPFSPCTNYNTTGDHLRAFEYISNATGDDTRTFRPTVMQPEITVRPLLSLRRQTRKFPINYSFLPGPPHAQTIRPERRRSPPGLRIHH